MTSSVLIYFFLFNLDICVPVEMDRKYQNNSVISVVTWFYLTVKKKSVSF